MSMSVERSIITKIEPLASSVLSGAEGATQSTPSRPDPTSQQPRELAQTPAWQAFIGDLKRLHTPGTVVFVDGY